MMKRERDHFAFGIRFEDRRAAERYQELKIEEAKGKIQVLKTRVKFPLIPDQKDEQGKIVERRIDYLADFTYFTKRGEFVVEDTRGIRTPEDRLKKALMYYMHKIRITEV